MPNYRSGFIYAIEATGTPYVKIGSTTIHVNDRIAALQIATPLRLTLVAVEPVLQRLREVEARIHVALRAHHTRGEWFQVTVTMDSLALLVANAILALDTPIMMLRKGLPPVKPRPRVHAPTSLAFRLIKMRTQICHSVSDLAKATDLDFSIIEGLESGQLEDLSAQMLRRLAVVLGCTTDYLLGLVDWPYRYGHPIKH